MQSKSLLKDIAKFVFFILLAVLLVWLFCRRLTPDEIDEIVVAFKQVNYWWFLPALFFGILSHLLRAWRWQMLLYPLGYKPTMWNMLFSVSIAYFANLAVPRLGEVARCGMLTKYEKVPFAKSFGTVVTERVIDMIVFLVIFVGNLFIQRELAMKCFDDITAQSNFGNLVSKIILGCLLLLIVICIIVVLLYARKHTFKSKFINKVIDMIRGFADGIKSLLSVKSPLMFVISSVMIWVCYLYMSKFMFYSLPDTASLGYDAAISGLAFCTIGTILIPGGIGLYPILAAAIYSLYGISTSTGFALGWLIWGNQTILIIFAGVLSLIVLPLYNKRRNNANA